MVPVTLPTACVPKLLVMKKYRQSPAANALVLPKFWTCPTYPVIVPKNAVPIITNEVEPVILYTSILVGAPTDVSVPVLNHEMDFGVPAQGAIHRLYLCREVVSLSVVIGMYTFRCVLS